MIKILLFIISVTLSPFVFSQTAETIRTGRPGQSIGPYTLGDKLIQLQSGIQLDESNDIETQTLNNVIRYGIGEHFEVSGVFDHVSNSLNQGGSDNLQIGARYSFLFDKSSLKALGVQLRTRFRGDGDFKRDTQAFIFRTAMAFKSLGAFSYSLNFEVQNVGEENIARYFYALNLSYSLTEKLGVFIEPYITALETKQQDFINGGFSYNLSKDLALDISAGQNLKDYQNKFISAGFSIRKLP